MTEGFSFSLRIAFDSERETEIAYCAVSLELSARKLKRSSSKLSIKKNVLSLNINAVDHVALRATVNSALRKIFLAKSVSEAL